MSKYIAIYEKLCPDDPLVDDDPRRPAIMAEMRAIHKAATEADAASVVEWWQVWPNPQHQTPIEFVQDARRMMRGETVDLNGKNRSC
jgi:hypothetical protein